MGAKGSERRAIVLESRHEHSISPVQDDRPQRPNDQMFKVVKQELPNAHILQMWEIQRSKCPEKPSSPNRMQFSHKRALIMLSPQEHQHDQKSNMARVKNKQPPLGGHLIVNCHNQTYQPEPKGYLL